MRDNAISGAEPFHFLDASGNPLPDLMCGLRLVGGLVLVAVPRSGGTPQPQNYGPARAISFSTELPGTVIGRNSGDPARWKRYRGGTAGTLWVDRGNDGKFSPLIQLEGNLAGPMWIGRRIYFLSDHEGHGNLYSCTPSGRDLVRHTDHDDFYVRFPRTDGRLIVYHAGADIHVFDPARNTSRKIDIRIRSTHSQRNRKFVSAERYLESFDLDQLLQAIHDEKESILIVITNVT